MSYDFRFPDLGEGIQEGTLIKWLVEVGAKVIVDQPFATVETDKAVVDLPSPVKGTVLDLHFNEGDTIKVGEVVISFKPLEGEMISETRPIETTKSKPELPGQKPDSPPGPEFQPGRVLATPHTRAYARKRGVLLTDVTPTGKNGRITDGDIDRAVSAEEQKTSPAPGPQQDDPEAPTITQTEDMVVSTQPRIVKNPDNEPVERVPLTHLRRVIAANMIESRRTSAHVTHVDEADVTDLYRLYKKAEEHHGAEAGITLLPFFIKAAVTALKNYPLMNASYDEAKQELLLKKYYHFGIAVDTSEGLIVPVLKDVDKKDILHLAGELSQLSDKARKRQLGLDELKGATFTLTNIGPIGGLFATPIIHQPELAIVGLHTIKDRPAVVEGEIVVRKMMYLSLSFDHRFIDGAEAARFVTHLVKLIESPELLMMRLL